MLSQRAACTPLQPPCCPSHCHTHWSRGLQNTPPLFLLSLKSHSPSEYPPVCNYQEQQVDQLDIYKVAIVNGYLCYCVFNELIQCQVISLLLVRLLAMQYLVVLATSIKEASYTLQCHYCTLTDDSQHPE